MTTVSLPPSSMTQDGEVARLPRCCEQHDDWRTLAEHLIDEFTSLAAGDVLRELARAKAAAAAFGLDESEQIGVGELMARHQLMLAAGEVPEVARLDPERHVRAERTA